MAVCFRVFIYLISSFGLIPISVIDGQQQNDGRDQIFAETKIRQWCKGNADMNACLDSLQQFCNSEENRIKSICQALQAYRNSANGSSSTTNSSAGKFVITV